MPEPAPKPAAARRQRAAQPGRLLSAADRSSFARLQRQLGADAGVAVAIAGRDASVSTAGTLKSGVAWSTSKVPLAMAVVERGLASNHRTDLRAAITASDNGAADALWQALGAGEQAAAATDEQLGDAGDDTTRTQPAVLRPGYSAFGQTDWALADQARFAAGMSCTSAGGEVLGLMGDIDPSQQWGLGAAGVPADFKGGWGPGVRPGDPSGWLDRQLGVLEVRGVPVAAAIAIVPGDGSHATGTSGLTEIARWVIAHLDVRGAGRMASC